MDTETLLRRVDPARLVEIPGPDSPEGLRIRDQVLSGRPVPEAARNTKTRRTMGFSVGALTTVAAAVVLLLVVLPTSVGPSKASAALSRLASTAATVPTSLNPGQYAYTEVEVTEATPASTETATVQTWVAADGSGRRVTTTGPTVIAVPPNEPTTVETFGPGTGSEVNGPIPIYDVSGLPTDPSALAQILNNENPGAQSLGALPTGIKSLDYVSSCSSAACSLFERAVALLQGPDVGDSPAFRQALFQVLATVPGVQLLGTTTDQAGQSGVGLALVEHQAAGNVTDTCATRSPSGTPILKSVTTHQPAISSTFSIVVDPQTTTLLSSERSSSEVPDPCGPPALQKPQAVENSSAYWSDVLASGVVNTDTAIPVSASN
jgi:hypothetical protein